MNHGRAHAGGGRRGSAFLVLSAALLAACVTYPSPRAIDAGRSEASAAPQPDARARPEPPDPWRLSRRVPVRIAALERERIVFARIDGVEHRLVVADDGVRLDAGAVEPFQVLERARTSLAIGERDYGRAALVVAPHPSHGLRAEIWLDLEDYVAGVVAAELVLWNATPALLEAQAIAARSYAVGTLDRRARADRAFLWDGVEDQAYRGRFVADAATQRRGVDTRLAEAVARTRGQVLTFGERVADVRYHAACGGHTSLAADVFGPGVPGGSRTSACPGCRVAPGWSRTLSATALATAAARLGLDRFGRPVPTRRDPSGRWLEVEVRGPRGVRPLSANELREALGWSALPSTWITGWTMRADGGALVTGRGRGHGVGLCQDGAADLAQRGWDAATILGHYYPGARLAHLRTPAPASPTATGATSGS